MTIDLPASLNEKIEAIRAAHALHSASEAIRMALAKFDMSGFRSDEEPRIQISVRIDPETRRRLKRISGLKPLPDPPPLKIQFLESETDAVPTTEATGRLHGKIKALWESEAWYLPWNHVAFTGLVEFLRRDLNADIGGLP